MKIERQVTVIPETNIAARAKREGGETLLMSVILS
jgi:hypothetical protein